jgi:hypothetical protein
MNPLKNLARVEARGAGGGKRVFQLCQIEFADV